MRRRVRVILWLGLGLGLGATMSHGEQKMRIHAGARTTEFTVSGVDSVTFYEYVDPPTGACCSFLPGGDCTITTQASCGAAWLGGGSTCSPAACDSAFMVRIPTGTFTMGSPANEPGRTSNETGHDVTLTMALYVSRYEVTQSEWQSVMGWNASSPQGADLPVESVTWFDCLSYCNRRSAAVGLDSVYVMIGRVYAGVHISGAGSITCDWAKNGYRLLTEAEWEYTCRAGSATPFCNGGITVSGYSCSPPDPNLDVVGWYCGNAGSATNDVGGKEANAWGLKDMHGNVKEWCWDWYGDYGTTPVTDPRGVASGSYRVIRGGDWGSYARDCRSAFRFYNQPLFTGRNVGLRVARGA